MSTYGKRCFRNLAMATPVEINIHHYTSLYIIPSFMRFLSIYPYLQPVVYPNQGQNFEPMIFNYLGAPPSRGIIPSFGHPVIPQVGVTSRTAVGLRNMLSEEVACKRKGARAMELKIQLGKKGKRLQRINCQVQCWFSGVYLKSLHKKERSAAISMFRSAHRRVQANVKKRSPSQVLVPFFAGQQRSCPPSFYSKHILVHLETPLQIILG